MNYITIITLCIVTINATIITKPDLGVTFEELGYVNQGVVHYHLIFTLELPYVELPATNYSKEIASFDCKQPKFPLYSKFCEKMLPDLVKNVEYVEQYRQELINLFEVKIMSIVDQYKSHKFKQAEPLDKQQDSNLWKTITNHFHRVKRFIFNIAQALLGTANSLLSWRKEMVMEKAVKVIERKQDMLEGNVYTLQDDLVSVAKYTSRSFKKFAKEVKELDETVRTIHEEFKYKLNELYKEIYNLIQLQNYIQIRSQYVLGKKINMLQEINGAAKDFMSALDSLSTGHLSHTIIPPYDLKDLLVQVKTHLDITYPELEMVMTTINQYYDLPLVDYTYIGNRTIAIMVPVLLRSKQLPPMKLYKASTNFVPYKMNPSLEQSNSFTKVELESDLLAIEEKGFRYVALDEQDLNSCVKIHDQYYCGTGFLTQYKGKQSCAIAVFRNETQAVLRDLCEFNYYYDIVPTPKIITSQSEVLIANLPLPWIFHCEEGHQQNNIIEGPMYAVVQRNIFCHCNMEATDYSIYSSPVNCIEPIMPIQVSYQVNKALYLTFEEPLPMTKSAWRETPADDNFDLPQMTYDSDSKAEVLEDIDSDIDLTLTPQHVIDLDEIAEAIQNRRPVQIPGTQQDVTDMDSWFSSGNSGMQLLFSGFILSLLCTCMILTIICLVARNKLRIQNLFRNLRQQHAMAAIPLVSRPIEAAPVCESPDVAEIMDMTWTNILILCCMQLCIVSSLYILYRLTRFLINKCRLVMWDGSKMTWNTCDFYLVLDSKKHGQEFLYMGSGLGFPTDYKLFGQLKYSNLSLKERNFGDWIDVSWYNNVDLYQKDRLIVTDICINIPWLKTFKVRKILGDRFVNIQIKLKYGKEFWNIPNLPERPGYYQFTRRPFDEDSILEEYSSPRTHHFVEKLFDIEQHIKRLNDHLLVSPPLLVRKDVSPDTYPTRICFDHEQVSCALCKQRGNTQEINFENPPEDLGIQELLDENNAIF